MPQALAKIILKTNEFGSTVTLQHVSPAELMFLVSDHHANAKGNPVIKLTVIPEDTEINKIAVLQKELDKTEKNRDKVLNLDETQITEELRTQRANTLSNKITSLQSQIADLQQIVNRRNASPAMEKAYLMSKYQAVRVKKMYNDKIPQFPSSFEEAIQLGIGSEAPSERLMFEPSGMLATP